MALSANNLGTFEEDLRIFSEQIVPQAHRQLQRDIVLKFFELVSLRNSQMQYHPRDTGFAQHNWRISVNAIPSDTTGVKLQGADNRAKQPSEIKWQMDHIKPFQIIWVFNNVDYMPILDLGSSLAAPYGIVEPALFDLRIWMANLP
jgi:hypothetical protein